MPCRRASFLSLFLFLSVELIGCGGGGSGSGGGSSNVIPVLTSVSPTTAGAGSIEATITLTGSNFVFTSTADWNGTPIATSYINPTTLVAQLPAVDLKSVGNGTITVSNPSPGGGTSTGLIFTVNTGLAVGETRINIGANDLAWDPINQVIYLSVPNLSNSNQDAVEALNPSTGTVGVSAFAGIGPNLLSVSKNSKYLYVGLNGAPNVQRLKLPNLGTDITLPLGTDVNFGPYYATAVQAAPTEDGTVAIVRGTPAPVSSEEGGVGIYDDGTLRPDSLCGRAQTACANYSHGGMDSFDSIQWSPDGTEMFSTDSSDTGSDFYSIPVTSSGFGAITDYPRLAVSSGGAILDIHFDPITGYIYDDNGAVIDPSHGMLIGNIPGSGPMVVDGSLGKIFFFGKFNEEIRGTTYTLESFDIYTLAPIATLQVLNVAEPPRHLIRWGSNGLAFTTCGDVQNGSLICSKNMGMPGPVYLISGSFVDGSGSDSMTMATSK